MRTILAAVAIVGLTMGSAIAEGDPGVGPNPRLPEPQQSLLPTVNIAPASSWPKDAKPQAGAGLNVTSFAEGLEHPRWLYALPNGDILVAETNAPPKPGASGVRSWVMRLVMRRATARRKAQTGFACCVMLTVTVWRR